MSAAAEDGPPTPVRIARIGPTRRMAALECLLGSDRRRAERFMHFAQRTAMNLDHLWCALDEAGKIHSTVLASPNPGSTAMLFLSHPGSDVEIQTSARLVQAAARGLGEAGICLAQALLTPDERAEMKAVEAGGLMRIAILTYMQRTLTRRDRRDIQVPTGCRLRSFETHDRLMLEELLARTYVETLDCPKLVGLRGMHDIVDGHMQSGTFKPEWWTILHDGDRPVGACLVNEARDGNSAELVYLGITPEARGRGLGGVLLAHSISLVAKTTMKTVVLAVDESNEPALEMYRRSGFRRTLRRHAFVRKVSGDAAHS